MKGLEMEDAVKKEVEELAEVLTQVILGSQLRQGKLITREAIHGTLWQVGTLDGIKGMIDSEKVYNRLLEKFDAVIVDYSVAVTEEI